MKVITHITKTIAEYLTILSFPQGGLTSISSDDLLFKESCVSALHYLVPVKTTKSFIIAQHTLQTTSQPYLLISPKGRKITCILNNCDESNKGKNT